MIAPTRLWLSRTYLLSREKKILPTYLFIYFIYFVLNDTNFPEKYYAPALRSSDNWDDFCFDLSKLKNSRLCSFLKTSLFHGPTGAEFRRFSFWVSRGYWWLQYFWCHRFAREKRFRLWKDYVPNTPVVPIQNKEFSGKVSMATLRFNFHCFSFFYSVWSVIVRKNNESTKLGLRIQLNHNRLESRPTRHDVISHRLFLLLSLTW